MNQIKIYYWSPHINNNVATVKAVLNSAKSLEKYSQKYDVNIINVFGEWEFCKKNNKESNTNQIYYSMRPGILHRLKSNVASKATTAEYETKTYPLYLHNIG